MFYTFQKKIPAIIKTAGKYAVLAVVDDTSKAEEILRKNIRPGDSVTCSCSGENIVFKSAKPKNKK